MVLQAEVLRGDVRSIEGRQDSFETMMTAVQSVERRVEKLGDMLDVVRKSMGTQEVFDDSKIR